MTNEKEKIQGLNEIRELAFSLYPNATKIGIVIDGEKIKIAPNEEYMIPVDEKSEE
ncbi:hypothetical protein D3C72_2270960 [compost metagenome]